jgi:flavin-dependent dehydrogenase
VSLSLEGGKKPRWLPDALVALPEYGRPGAADVTWRIADRTAGPGWFLAGEAACTLDPAASQGVLRALMSGMMAAHHAAQIHTGASQPTVAERSYAAWLQSWFQHDAARLLMLYRARMKDFPATLFHA